MTRRLTYPQAIELLEPSSSHPEEEIEQLWFGHTLEVDGGQIYASWSPDVIDPTIWFREN